MASEKDTDAEERKGNDLLESHGHCLLGCKLHNFYQLYYKWENKQWGILLQCYYNLLQHLSDEDKKTRSHLAKKKVLFRQDNALIHTSVAMTKLVELLLHPLYSPNLALCNFYIFPNLKKWPRGNNFLVIVKFDCGYFEELDKSSYENGTMTIEYR